MAGSESATCSERLPECSQITSRAHNILAAVVFPLKCNDECECPALSTELVGLW